MKKARHRDFAKISLQKGVQEFSSVPQIFFFMEQMLQEGMDEHHFNLALDVFLRDAAIFEEEDLENETFKEFIREIDRNMLTFQNQTSYVKTAQFLDWYCIEDKLLWVNLEQFVIKKERLFTADSYVQLLSHFSN